MTVKEIYNNFAKMGSYELYREPIIQILEEHPRLCGGGLATGAQIAADFDGFRASREYLASPACFDSMRKLARFLLEYTPPEVADIVGETYLDWMKFYTKLPDLYVPPALDEFSLGEAFLLVMLIDNQFLKVQLTKEGEMVLC